jgi:putative sigma-54 modulation protein
MQIGVTFRHREAEEGIKEYAKDKVGKLEKYLGNPQEVHVVLSAEKFRQTAEITIVADGMTLNSQGRDTDLYTAIDQMVEKMERQIRERQKKSKWKRVNPFSLKFPFLRNRPTAQETPEPEMSVKIQRRQVFAKPMSPEEAVAQLDLSQGEILFFINSNSGQMNALTRGKGGVYQWVEPQPD